MATLTVVTRASLLATTQTGHVVAALQAAHPELEIIVRELNTKGDRRTDVPLPEVGGKGLFTAELEAALLSGEADIAIHSLKDLPTELPAGLIVGAIPARVEPRDALVLPQAAEPANAGEPLPMLQVGAKVGSSSPRRQAMLKNARPDLQFADIRGNLDTRLRKLDEGQYDALILAAAGLTRLGWGERISALLPIEVCVPAPAQGALAIESRGGDERVAAILEPLDDLTSRQAVTAERALLDALGGGCQLPLGALAEPEGDGLVLHAAVAAPDGTTVLRRVAAGPAAQAESLGKGLAEALLSDGAARLL